MSFMIKERPMKTRRAIASVLLVASTLTIAASVGASTAPTGCNALTLALAKADGYSSATGPVVTPYNYKKGAHNAANAIGTTIDFGSKALVVGCLDPANLHNAWTAQQFSGTATTATAFMTKLVAAAQGAMTKTTVGPVTDYLDFGNGKEDGVGSLSTAKSLRLDAWVANGKYVIVTFSQPAAAVAPKALLAFMKSTVTLLK